jgi:hypothetical protein
MGVAIEISVKHPGGPLERRGLIYSTRTVLVLAAPLGLDITEHPKAQGHKRPVGCINKLM